MKRFIVFFVTAGALLGSCNKQDPIPGGNAIYWRSTINGQSYSPHGCTNCYNAELIGDTSFLVHANNDYYSVSVGIVSRNIVQAGVYPMSVYPNATGVFSDQPYVRNSFQTDSLHRGTLNITRLERTNKIVEGNFDFYAYNALRDSTVHVVGSFRKNLEIY